MLLLGVHTALASPKARQEYGAERLRFVLILTRHGVRSPTKPNDQLDPYSGEPWPAWEVAPGELTPRGTELEQLFGAYNREWLQHEHLLPDSGCPPAGAVFLHADSDRRTLRTAEALASSILPGCGTEVHSLPNGVADPLFHPIAAGIAPPRPEATLAALSLRVAGDAAHSTASNAGPLGQLAHILAPDPARPPRAPLLEVPARLVPGTGDHMASLTGPLPTGSSLAENLLLEYADGKPAGQVGWGRVDESSLRSLLALHTAYFDLLHRTPLLAQAEASNLLLHILDTLQQAATGTPFDGAVGPAGARLVLLAGHDTNLASLAALLGLHWTLDGRSDDTPPGAQLAFELWHNQATGEDRVRLVVRMQTLRQLRDATRLSLQTPPATQSLSVPGCGRCKPGRLDELGRKALRLAYTGTLPALSHADAP